MGIEVTGFIRVKQPYGPTAAPAGTATPRTSMVRFGSGVGDAASYNVNITPAGGFGLGAHALISSTPAGTTGIVAYGSALGGTFGLHKIEVVAGSRILGTIAGSSSVVTLQGLAVPAVGSRLFAALSYDDAAGKATLWTWTTAGGLTEVTVPVPFTPVSTSAFCVAHNGDGVTFPGYVEQATGYGFKFDGSTVQKALRAPVDVSSPLVAAAAGIGLPGAQAHTNTGSGFTRLRAPITATITAGAAGGDPAGTTHRILLPAASGVVTGRQLVTSWGIAMTVLGVTVGAGATPDVLTCMRS